MGAYSEVYLISRTRMPSCPFRLIYEDYNPKGYRTQMARGSNECRFPRACKRPEESTQLWSGLSLSKSIITLPQFTAMYDTVHLAVCNSKVLAPSIADGPYQTLST